MALRKCACIDTLYTELDWLDRFQAAKDDGFEAVEFWDWRIRDLDATREAAQKAGIAISGFNGDADYSLVDPTHKEPYLAYLKQSIDAAQIAATDKPVIALDTNINSDKVVSFEGSCCKGKVKEIGRQAGYRDNRHFCKMFKRVTGMTPAGVSQTQCIILEVYLCRYYKQPRYFYHGCFSFAKIKKG